MKVSREQAAENRARVVEVAGRLFRENGFDGVGVADIMKGAGLTHGGFYGQFGSKDELAAEAAAQTLDRSIARWARLAEEGRDPLAAIVASYLARTHRDAPGSGCAMAALSAQAARQPKAVRGAFTAALNGFVGVLTKLMPGSPAARRRKALATMAGLVGAVILSRAVNDAALSDEILAAAAKEFG
jgi:TetR/AcrR family transcriptional repressor of nem operon